MYTLAARVTGFFATIFATAGLALLTQNLLLAISFVSAGAVFGVVTICIVLVARTHRSFIISTLGQLLEEAVEIRMSCGNEATPPPTDKAEAWGKKVETFLVKHLGKTYLARLVSSAGLPMAANSISSLEHRQLWGTMYRFEARLGEFLRELEESRN